MAKQLRIDFVSDVSCPWCAIGLSSLELALARVKTAVAADIHFQPFELNPDMGPDGQDIVEHITEKYGATAEQQANSREMIRQRDLKMALFEAYFTHCQDPSCHDVLLDVVERVGLDRERAQRILESDEYADEVREREQFFQRAGIHSVPAIVINQRHLISGGQPPEVFEQALREIASRDDAAPRQ